MAECKKLWTVALVLTSFYLCLLSDFTLFCLCELVICIALFLLSKYHLCAQFSHGFEVARVGSTDWWGTMSFKKPGRNCSILSYVADHKVRWQSCRASSLSIGGGTRIPVAFITRITFLSDSGTASYLKKRQIRSKRKHRYWWPHQLVSMIHVHQSV